MLKKKRKKYTFKSPETQAASLKNLVSVGQGDPIKVQEWMDKRALAVNQPVLPADEPKTYKDLVMAARMNTLAALETITSIMNNEEASFNTRLNAAEIIIERGWGKAIAPTGNISVGDHKPDDEDNPAGEPAKTFHGIALPKNRAQWARDVAAILKEHKQMPGALEDATDAEFTKIDSTTMTSIMPETEPNELEPERSPLPVNDPETDQVHQGIPVS